MNVIAINGSPRKGWNTNLLVEEALKGAASKGAETELVNLYDIEFKGCISCLQCKLKNGQSSGHCVIKDSLKPILDKIDRCDGLILGSPIYFGEVTSSMRAFIERLAFQYSSYQKEVASYFNRRIGISLIWTMNLPESALDIVGYTAKFDAYEKLFGHIFGSTKTIYSTETWLTTDYDKYELSVFDKEARKKRREEVFPKDLQNAFEIGASLIE